MGSRINYLLIEPAGHRLFYSHWGAQSVDRDAFWGPAATLSFVLEQRPIDHLLDDVWAEGGLVLDTTRRELALWGGEEINTDVPLRRLYMQMLAEMWPGWSVRWAHEGILELARRIGVPDADVLARDPEKEVGVGGPAAPDLLRTILTVARAGRAVEAYALGSVPAQTLLLGPDLLHKLGAPARMPPMPRLVWVWNDASWMDGGVHIDEDRRTIWLWCVRELSDLARIRARWPGWTVHLDGDRFEDHAARTGGAVTITSPPREDLLATLREILMRSLDRRSPAEGLAKLFPEASEVHVNPLALQDHHGPEIGKDDRGELLDRLFERFRNT